MRAQRKLDALLDEIAELPSATQAELMHEMVELYAEYFGLDPLDDADEA